MTLLDDPREALGMALKRKGHSYNTRNTKEIEAAANDLKEQKPLTMCYTSDQTIIQLAAGDSFLAQAYSGDVYQAARSNKSVRYIIPHSGASLWVDNMCMPSTAPHVDNAYKWLNFMLEPKIAAANAKFTRYATPNQAAFDLVGDDLRSDTNLYPSEQLLSRCDELGDVGQLVFLYDRLWTELKCT
jgi:spermidine/putrescine transport system substrate-binding protein